MHMLYTVGNEEESSKGVEIFAKWVLHEESNYTVNFLVFDGWESIIFYM